jgi:predicted transcriptional regulator
MNRALARHTDPSTSHDAAESVNVTALEQIVLNALKQHHEGATTEQLSDWLALSLVTISPRIRPLVRKGLVIDSGFKRCNASGRKSIVWRVASHQMRLPL